MTDMLCFLVIFRPLSNTHVYCYRDLISLCCNANGRHWEWSQTGVCNQVSRTTAAVATMISDVTGYCLTGGWQNRHKAL